MSSSKTTKKVSSPLRWPGGKARLACEIIPRLADHTAYVETCCGGAGVFWSKPKEMSVAEILNDLDGELVNFYRMLHKRGKWLAREVDSMPYGRGTHKRMFYSTPSSQYSRAVRFWYLNRVGFGGKTHACDFGVKKSGPCYVLPQTILSNLDATIERLRGVLFECVDVVRLLQIYDAPTTCFYIDPPYHNVCQEYAKSCRFTEADHERLAFAVHGLDANWLLSYNDTSLIRRLYADCSTIAIEHRWYMGCNTKGKSSSQAREILISNRQLNSFVTTF